MVKNKKTVYQKNFNKKSGLLMICTGVLGALTVFMSNGGNYAYLSTQIQTEGIKAAGKGSVLFKNELSWEAIMAITLSVALIIGGIIVFFASKNLAKK